MSDQPEADALDALLVQIPQAAREGPAGIRSLFDQALDLCGTDNRLILVVLFAEHLLPYPSLRSELAPDLDEGIRSTDPDIDIPLFYRALAIGARLRTQENRPDDAQVYLDTMDRLARERHDAFFICLARLIGVEGCLARNELEAARAGIDSLLADLADAPADHPAVQASLHHARALQVSVATQTGDLDYLQDAMDALPPSDSAQVVPFLAFHRAMAAQNLGRGDEAREWLHRALVETSDPRALTWIMEARLALADLEPDRVDMHLCSADDLAQAIGSREAGIQVEVARMRQDLAKERYASACERARALEGIDDPHVLASRAEALITAGFREEAAPVLEAALRLAEQQNLGALLGQVHTLSAALAASPEERALHVQAALAWAEQAGDLPGQARARAWQALVETDMQAYGQAIDEARAARQMAEQVGRPDIQALAEMALGVALVRLGKKQEGHGHLRKALALAQEHKVGPVAWRALKELGDDEAAANLAASLGMMGDPEPDA